MNLHITDLSKSYQKLEEKALTIYKLSGYTLDNIISMLAKGFTFVPPENDNASLSELAQNFMEDTK